MQEFLKAQLAVVMSAVTLGAYLDADRKNFNRQMWGGHFVIILRYRGWREKKSQDKSVLAIKKLHEKNNNIVLF